MVRSTDHEAPLYVVFTAPFTSSLLGTNILLSTLFSDAPSLCSSLNVRDHISRPYKKNRKTAVLCILNFTILDSKLEDRKFCTE